MKYAIQIPKPCHESWQEMTPESNGRHCAQCSKTVIDFTGWVQEDIHRYIEQQGPAKICGRFREEQLMPSDAERIIRSIAFAPLPLYKKVAAIFLLAFGLVQMSCNTETPKAIQHAAIITNDTPQKKIENVTLGMVAPPQLHQKQKSKTEHIVMGGIAVPLNRRLPDHATKPSDSVRNETHLKGEVEYIPSDTTRKRGQD